MSEQVAAATGDNGTATGAAPSQAPQPQPWTAGFDEDTNAYVQNKGWKDPADLLNSYKNLEKFAGGSKNLVEIPGEDADIDRLSQFYNKLGRPESPDKYGIEAGEGLDAELTEWYKNTSHELGLTGKQAKALFEKWNETVSQRETAMQQETVRQQEQDIQSLKKEWGQAYENQIDAGRRAVNALGYDQNQLNAMEDKLGTAEMLKLFAQIGSKMGEDSFAGGERSGGSFGLTPAAARQQIADLKLDSGFMSKYTSGDKDAIAKMTKLMEAAYA
jgi:hypothetical protein